MRHKGGVDVGCVIDDAVGDGECGLEVAVVADEGLCFGVDEGCGGIDFGVDVGVDLSEDGEHHGDAEGGEA